MRAVEASQILILAGLVASAPHAEDKAVDLILGTSTIHPAEFLKDGAELWAVVRDGAATYRLERRVVQIEEYDYINPAMDDAPLLGKRLIGPGAERAVIHLSASLDLEEGPIFFEELDYELIHYSFSKETDPPTPATFDLGERRFRLRVVFNPIEGGEKSMLVFLDEGTRSQMIFSYRRVTDPNAKVDWVGDIDRDGIPDFLLSLSHHYASVSKRLYLSSFAEGNDLTKQVGGFDIPYD